MIAVSEPIHELDYATPAIGPMRDRHFVRITGVIVLCLSGVLFSVALTSQTYYSGHYNAIGTTYTGISFILPDASGNWIFGMLPTFVWLSTGSWIIRSATTPAHTFKHSPDRYLKWIALLCIVATVMPLADSFIATMSVLQIALFRGFYYWLGSLWAMCLAALFLRRDPGRSNQQNERAPAKRPDTAAHLRAFAVWSCIVSAAFIVAAFRSPVTYSPDYVTSSGSAEAPGIDYVWPEKDGLWKFGIIPNLAWLFAGFGVLWGATLRGPGAKHVSVLILAGFGLVCFPATLFLATAMILLGIQMSTMVLFSAYTYWIISFWTVWLAAFLLWLGSRETNSPSLQEA
jgi:hypothetical protein